jgi:hypothetical protein
MTKFHSSLWLSKINGRLFEEVAFKESNAGYEGKGKPASGQ